MKKSLIALAVLAASGASMAQSSVTLYGVADVWFGRTAGDVTTNGVKVKTPSQTVLNDGLISNSRFGFKGSEDLGGGLKANFQLEQGFSIDTGATASAGFNRQAWVGMSGGFGEVQLGKAYNAFDDVSALAASVFDSDLAPINNVFVSTAFASADANTIKYATPSFGGFSGAASYSLGEDKTAAFSASKVYALSGKYENGPLAVGIAFANAKSTNPASINGAYDVDGTRLAASYNLGAAKLLASYGRVSATDEKTNEYEIGVDVPLSAALTLSAGYAKSKTKLTGVTEFDDKSFGVAATYSLSKRTTLYAGLNTTKFDTVSLNEQENAKTYAVGVKHTF
jgi:predicted porin